MTPTNLAEALDALQAFLPADRSISISSYRGQDTLAGLSFVHVSSMSINSEIQGSSHGRHKKLSDALFEAEADYAAKWIARHARVAAAEAEFGPYCPRLAA